MWMLDQLGCTEQNHVCWESGLQVGVGHGVLKMDPPEIPVGLSQSFTPEGL